MAERTDLAWIQQLKQEDEDAITDLWQRLFTWALTITRRYDQTEDVGRDAAVAAYHRIIQRGIYQYKFQCPFPGFCRRILVNELNRRMKPTSYFLDIDDPSTPHPSEEMKPPKADAETIRKRLEPCMDKLKPREHELIAMRYLQEMSPQTIAERLGIQRNNINQLLHRVRKKLLDCLQGLGFMGSTDLFSV